MLLGLITLLLTGFAGPALLQHLVQSPHSPVRWLPSLWFLGLYQDLQLRSSPVIADLAHSALLGTPVVFVLMLVVLIGASALVIDVGSWFKVKRSAQAVADASALGAVQDLPSSSFAVSLDVGRLRSANNFSGSVTASLSATYAAGDTITAEATDHAPSFFAKVFGIGSATVGARASATIASYKKGESYGGRPPCDWHFDALKRQLDKTQPDYKD